MPRVFSYFSDSCEGVFAGGYYMKIKTRLAIAFITITVVPIALIYIAVMGLVNYQGRSFQKNYGLNEQIDLLSGNSMQVFNRLTQGVYNHNPEGSG